jgi:hypothetical protein
LACLSTQERTFIVAGRRRLRAHCSSSTRRDPVPEGGRNPLPTGQLKNASSALAGLTDTRLGNSANGQVLHQ